MLENQKRSKLFAFSLQAQDTFGKAVGLTILWSIWALFFSNLESIFIAKVIPVSYTHLTLPTKRIV